MFLNRCGDSVEINFPISLIDMYLYKLWATNILCFVKSGFVCSLR